MRIIHKKCFFINQSFISTWNQYNDDTGQFNLIYTGNNEAIKQAHALIHTLIKDPDVDLVKLLADTTPPAVPPIVAPAPSKAKPTPAVNNTGNLMILFYFTSEEPELLRLALI